MSHLVVLLFALIVAIVGSATMAAGWMESNPFGFVLGFVFFISGLWFINQWGTANE